MRFLKTQVLSMGFYRSSLPTCNEIISLSRAPTPYRLRLNAEGPPDRGRGDGRTAKADSKLDGASDRLLRG